MRDILPTIERWINEEKPFALARIVSTWGSAPRQVGAAMVVSESMEFAGSVSGGCVEANVIDEAIDALAMNRPRVVEFGVDNELAWSVGLSCGGKMRVLVEPFASLRDEAAKVHVGHKLVSALRENRPAILLSSLSESHPVHLLVSSDGATAGSWRGDLAEAVAIALHAYRHRHSGEVVVADQPVFVHVLAQKTRMLVVGANDIAVHLVALAKPLDFETVLIDPRKVFTARDRFATPPDVVFEKWPQEVLPEFDLNDDTYAVLLTHDPKIDDAALHFLLESNVPYIGALGGRKTQTRRRQRLLDAGFLERHVDRIRGPVGIDINASTPAEIALSIMAEVIDVKNRRGE